MKLFLSIKGLSRITIDIHRRKRKHEYHSVIHIYYCYFLLCTWLKLRRPFDFVDVAAYKKFPLKKKHLRVCSASQDIENCKHDVRLSWWEGRNHEYPYWSCTSHPSVGSSSSPSSDSWIVLDISMASCMISANRNDLCELDASDDDLR